MTHLNYTVHGHQRRSFVMSFPNHTTVAVGRAPCHACAGHSQLMISSQRCGQSLVDSVCRVCCALVCCAVVRCTASCCTTLCDDLCCLALCCAVSGLLKQLMRVYWDRPCSCHLALPLGWMDSLTRQSQQQQQWQQLGLSVQRQLSSSSSRKASVDIQASSSDSDIKHSLGCSWCSSIVVLL